MTSWHVTGNRDTAGICFLKPNELGHVSTSVLTTLDLQVWCISVTRNLGSQVSMGLGSFALYREGMEEDGNHHLHRGYVGGAIGSILPFPM